MNRLLTAALLITLTSPLFADVPPTPAATRPASQPTTRPLVKISKDHPTAPGEKITVLLDFNDVPDLKEWAMQAGDYALKWYPVIEKELASPGYTPPRQFTIRFKDVKGVASTSGGVITVSAAWPRQHPDDIGMIGHELVHVIQQYRSRRNPGWLVEGVADYVRYYVIEPGAKMGRFDPNRSDYKRGYQPAAGLLNHIETTKGPGIVSKLNQAMREGNFQPDTFKTLCGGESDELWEQFKTSADAAKK